MKGELALLASCGGSAMEGEFRERRRVPRAAGVLDIGATRAPRAVTEVPRW